MNNITRILMVFLFFIIFLCSIIGIKSKPINKENINTSTTTTVFEEDTIQDETSTIIVSTSKETTTEASTTTTTATTTSSTTKRQEGYTEEELNILSHLVYGEASGQSDEMQIAVASVVLNRVKSSSYPNTIKGVVFQSGQYACTWDGNYNKTPDKQAIKNAKFVLENGSQLPSNVVYQAEFIQGSGIYKTIGNTYFCYQ